MAATTACEEQVEATEGGGSLQEVIGGDVAQVHAVGEALRHDGCGKLLDLGVPQPVELRTTEFGRADTGKAGCGLHHAALPKGGRSTSCARQTGTMPKASQP